MGPQPPQPQVIEAQQTLKAAQPKELRLKIGEFEILEPNKEAKQPLQFQYLSNKCFYLFRVKANTPVAYVGIRRGETERKQHYFEAKPYEYAFVEAKADGSEAVVVNRNGANKEQDPPEEIDRVQVLAGGAVPKPDDPKPDDPNPIVPIPGAGLRVLFVYETKDLSKLPSAQVQMLTAKVVLDYLDAKCVKENGVPEYRKFDQNVDTRNMSEVWRQAMAKPRKSIPWLLISNGKDGYEGEWPKNTDELLKLLKKYGGE